MTILYPIGDSLYVNITNQCPCRCVFCIRMETDHVGNSGSLWLDHEPSIEEVKEEFKKFNIYDYKEIVFCGYGEPLVRLNEIIEISNFIKSISNIKIRINTNGLADLIHNKDTAVLLKDSIDAVSISLNAPDKKRYYEVTRPKFGEKSFDALLKFASQCKKYLKDVSFSVVDEISDEEIDNAKKLAKDMDIPLRVRHKQ